MGVVTLQKTFCLHQAVTTVTTVLLPQTGIMELKQKHVKQDVQVIRNAMIQFSAILFMLL
jgi:hypothetical protein